MSKHRAIAYGSPIPQSFLDALQEFLGSQASPNFAVTILNPTTLRVVAGADNAQVSIAINGKLRWNNANADAAAPGGLTVGDNPVFVAANDNSFTPGGPIGEVDSTDYTFDLIVKPVGGTPSGTGAEALYRQIGVATWDGTKFIGVKLSLFGGLVAADFSKAGTLATIPTATTVPGGTEYLATDDHGGRKYRSNGAAWSAVAPPNNGEWPLGSAVDWPWAAGSIPAWTALPYGQALAAASYPDLDTLDTAAGHPNGVSTGNILLPDYRGRIGVGKGDMGGVNANRITVAISGTNGATLGATFGVEGISLTTGQLPAHTHTTPVHSHGVPDHRHGITNLSNIPNMGVPDAPGGQPGETDGVSTNLGGTALTTGTAAPTTDPAGSGSAHQNTQPSIIVNKIMRVL